MTEITRGSSTKEFGYAHEDKAEVEQAIERLRALELPWVDPPRLVHNEGRWGWVGSGDFSPEQVRALQQAIQPSEQVVVPRECFDSQGRAACFLCDGERWPTLVVPATREATDVLAAWAQHALAIGPGRHRVDRPVLATLTSPVHAWQWPAT